MLNSNLKQELGIRNLLMMYVGNLETYQGIDLLLESFALAQQQNQQANLVIIGGEASDIAKYQAKAQSLDINEKVYFLGPRPVEDLALYLAQADILVSPRTKGKNTPMKLYSYLDSGKALLATDLPTHTQLLDNRIAMLAAPQPEAFAAGIINLVSNASLRSQLGSAGRNLIQQKHTYQAFREKLNSLYDWLQADLRKGAATGAA